MKPCAFEMHRPRELAEALELLERHGDDARLIAGGQSLVPMMNLRMAAPAILIDLNTVNGLSGIRRDGDVIRIGAMTRQQSLLDNELIRQHVPLMAEAVRHIGHYSTRSRGTVGGSLANADPSSELALVAVTLGADLTIRSATQTRTIAAQDFFLGELKTSLEPTEILVELVVAVASEGSKVAFREHARRHGDFATASAAAQLSPKEGILRAGLGAVGPVPVVCGRIQDAFRRGSLLAELDDVIAAEIADSGCDIGCPHQRRLPPQTCSRLSCRLRQRIDRVTEEKTTLLRVEDRRLLTGQGRFVDDIHLDRMVHAVFVRSPHAHAEVASVDIQAAMKAGALAVLTASDLPFIQSSLFIPRWHPSVRKVLPKFLAVDRVRYVGEPVALVVATDRYAAEDFAALVNVDYRTLDPIRHMRCRARARCTDDP